MPVLLLALHAFSVIHVQKILHFATTRRRRSHIQRRLRLRKKMFLRQIMRQRSPIAWTHPQSCYWWDTIVPDFSEQQFVQNFRVSRESFQYIYDQTSEILAKKDTTCRLCVPVRKRIAIAIWKLATGSEYRTIRHLFGVGLSTVFNCVQEFCNAVIQVLLPVHVTTPDATKLVKMASFFKSHWRAPQCVGAIDSSHIPIIAPEKYPRDYCNRKGWHSVVLQAVVDGKGLFWDVCVGFPGSVCDARVLKQSHL